MEGVHDGLCEHEEHGENGDDNVIVGDTGSELVTLGWDV